MALPTRFDELENTELVARFLRSRNGQTALERARDVMEHCKDFRLLLSEQRLPDHLLTGKERDLLRAALELSTRYTLTKARAEGPLSSPDDVRTYLSMKLSGLEHEVFGGILLNNRHQILECRDFFQGTVDSAACYPREIVKHCLRVNACAALFYHNHPSGVAEPSDTDVRLTRKLVDALSLVDIRVLDHVVVGAATMTSLAERGLM